MNSMYYYVLVALIVLGCSSNREDRSTAPNLAITQIPVGNPTEGKSLYNTCQTCHGKEAQGNHQLGAPTLANSDDWYMYRQLMNFKKGIRGYLVHDTLGLQMAAMSKMLKDSIAISHVVSYIMTMPEVILPSIIKGDIKKGERTYQSTCGSCHGPGAKGNEKMFAPRLNGLEDWYLKSQISKFKNSIRGAHPSDKLGSQMVAMVSLLGDEQAVDDVIAYIRSTTQTVTK